MTLARRQFVVACALGFLCAHGTQALAQKHNGHSSPPTAPPPAVVAPAAPLVPISSGLGAIQFVQVSYGVPAPQALTRQLRFDDDRTRAAALSAIGAPNQYMQRGHIALPKAISLELVPLSNTDELDALLTVELDQHIVTAVLVPVDTNWKRIATLTFPTNFNDASTTPGTWLTVARALLQPERYRAIFHASFGNMSGNFTENEAHLRILNSRAVITLSFASTERECSFSSPPTAKPNEARSVTACNLAHRWFQPDPVDPLHRFELVTGLGKINAKDAADPYANSRTFLVAHLRTFSCQPFVFNEGAGRYEPAAANAACRTAPVKP